MDLRDYLLDDESMWRFIEDGHISFQLDASPSLHREVYRQVDQVFNAEGNPGNDILAKAPALQQIFNHPQMQGVLSSLLGPEYIMHPHRHCHLNPPHSPGQGTHQDSYEDDQNMRHHRTRWLMVFYYPQDVSADMGPTAITPGTHFFTTSEGASQRTETPLRGAAGSVTVVQYDLWHRATVNDSEHKRYMLKFLFCRMREPRRPAWNNRQSAPPQKGGEKVGFGAHLWNWHRGVNAGPRQREANGLGALREGLNHADEAVRLEAAYQLGGLGTAGVPVLMEELQREAAQALAGNLQRSHTNPSQLNALYGLSTAGSAAVPALVAALDESDWWMRAAAADALGDIGLPDTRAVGKLGAALSDGEAWVRRNAAEALGIIGPAASGQIGRLADLLDDPYSWVRHNAVSSLARIDCLGAVPLLHRALGDEEVYVRGNAAVALEHADRL
ncbi:MAG: phytanoyl-CoA dioxygenase [Candidatus Latescibacteria bacterium]|nr:phytanoyl-CoA dioxygenase [Candidatus Latescibacterota bacterium]